MTDPPTNQPFNSPTWRSNNQNNRPNNPPFSDSKIVLEAYNAFVDQLSNHDNDIIDEQDANRGNDNGDIAMTSDDDASHDASTDVGPSNNIPTFVQENDTVDDSNGNTDDGTDDDKNDIKNAETESFDENNMIEEELKGGWEHNDDDSEDKISINENNIKQSNDAQHESSSAETAEHVEGKQIN